jgi:hypothetical protein
LLLLQLHQRHPTAKVQYDLFLSLLPQLSSVPTKQTRKQEDEEKG